MGILPEDFYRMRFRDYILLKNGFYNKRLYEQRVLRNVVTIAISPHLQKAPVAERIWPIAGDDEIKRERDKRVSEETLKILNRHKEGGFVYVKVGNKIVPVKKENN